MQDRDQEVCKRATNHHLHQLEMRPHLTVKSQVLPQSKYFKPGFIMKYFHLKDLNYLKGC